jgi:Pvc16 N-terminal domain
MSNYLAIATVTATLQRLLQAAVQVDVPGAKVTTVRPEATGGKTPEVGVNIYLYQATPNPAWRNYDLRNRRPKGELIKHAQAGLDLFYIMTFYGNEVELEPQRLLGSAVRTIVDHPILTPEMIRATVNHSTFSYLADSTLEQQVERVTIVPSQMNTEELSKIWSVFFQTPYVLSFACQGGAVLIEGNRTSGRALPVRSTQFYTTPNQPMVDQAISEAGANQPIVADSTLMIRGKRLQADRVQVRIGEARVTPQQVSEKEIQLDLASLPLEEAQNLRAGVQQLWVLHPIIKRSPLEPDRAVASNVMPFVLCPQIVAEPEVFDLWENEEDAYGAELRVQVDLTVGSEQRALLFLNERSNNNPVGYIFAAKPRAQDSDAVVFPILDVKAGEYLVRVQIDGAESPLEVDGDNGYVGPVVVIG